VGGLFSTSRHVEYGYSARSRSRRRPGSVPARSPRSAGSPIRSKLWRRVRDSNPRWRFCRPPPEVHQSSSEFIRVGRRCRQRCRQARLPSGGIPGAAPSRSHTNLGMAYPGLRFDDVPSTSAVRIAASPPQRRQLPADGCCRRQSRAALHYGHIRAARTRIEFCRASPSLTHGVAAFPSRQRGLSGNAATLRQSVRLRPPLSC
jgi:hypothetical protein